MARRTGVVGEMGSDPYFSALALFITALALPPVRSALDRVARRNGVRPLFLIPRGVAMTASTRKTGQPSFRTAVGARGTSPQHANVSNAALARRNGVRPLFLPSAKNGVGPLFLSSFSFLEGSS